MDHPIPMYTLEGVRHAEITTHPFSTEDGLGLSLTRMSRGSSDDVVLLVHGLTTSTDMWIMPEHRNLVTALHEHGYADVWSLDSRMSNRSSYNLAPHAYTLDDLALFDYPAAIAKMREQIGNRRIHVITHCLGAVSFTMSVFAGAVTGIASLVANSVALTPRVPTWSACKLAVAPFLLEKVLGFPYLSPRWGDEPGLTRGKILSKLVSLFHHECDVPACHMLSMMWGSGAPALYSHDLIHEITHRRAADLYGGTSMNYHRHVRAMVRAGRAIKFAPKNERHAALPDDYLSRAADVRTPILFTTGENNDVFVDSNIVCHRELEAVTPGRHALHVFPRYGHQDVFMGKDADVDVFPRVLRFLDEHREAASRRPIRRPVLRAATPGSREPNGDGGSRRPQASPEPIALA